jgi:hypothetical protein
MLHESSVLWGGVPELVIAVVVVTLIGGGYSACRAEGANSPKLFAPGVVSSPADDQSPAFAPDGKSVYFTRRSPSAAIILKSTFANGRWLRPTVASFSGQWRDLEPAMAPNGTYLIFASNRPSIEGKSALDGNYNGKIRPAAGGNLWRVDREGDGWRTPKRLSDAINQGTAVFAPSVAADGNLYFMRWVEETGGFHLFRSQYDSGQYMPAEPVRVGDATTDEMDPAVAPNESFLVYSSSHPAKNDQTRLLIAFRVAGGWSTPHDLGDEVNEAGDNIESRLSPDHRMLYFSTNTVPPVPFPRTRQQSEHDLQEMMVWANGRQNIWYVSLAAWLDAKQP